MKTITAEELKNYVPEEDFFEVFAEYEWNYPENNEDGFH